LKPKTGEYNNLFREYMQYEKRKIPGISYSFTESGIELPILDITHPLFKASIDKTNLEKLRKTIEKTGDKMVIHLKEMPSFLKNFLSQHSYIIAGFLSINKENNFLSGISTLMMKLGPGLIGNGIGKIFERRASRSISSVTLRVRIQDICKLEAEALVTQLIQWPDRNLCFINIGGGTASDSINTLILILKKDPSLLKNRKIEINVLDMDTFGPGFGNNCIESLKTPGQYFHLLDISFRYIKYNWNDPSGMESLLTERKEWITLCSSEGGLFEYGTNEDIVSNLNLLYDKTGDEMKIAGSLIKDSLTVDKGMLTILEKTNINTRLLGINGLLDILTKTQWIVDHAIDDNPRYVVFTLNKKHAS
jgi:hypothetical protein